jgi:lipoprotein-releasing system ATP-binding protein
MIEAPPAETRAGQAGLVVSDLRKEYPTRAEPLVVLRDVSLTLEAGDAMAIMGPSGSGKSTLLHILGTLERPTAGSVRLAGRDPFQLGERDLASFRNRQIGFVFQDHHLLPQCSALENVLIPTLPYGAGDTNPEARARELLRRVGLSDRIEHRPAELSGGERQRVAVARAFINRPPLVLADEPTGNLDRRNARIVADLFFELHGNEGAMLLVVTHSSELAARFPRRADLVDGTLERAPVNHCAGGIR